MLRHSQGNGIERQKGLRAETIRACFLEEVASDLSAIQKSKRGRLEAGEGFKLLCHWSNYINSASVNWEQ
jgi:hypothetical protein